MFLRSQLKELDFEEKIQEPTEIFGDNQSALKLIKNPIHHSRTKHIDIKYHFIRDIYEKGYINVNYIPTQEMTADICTKNLSRNNHEKCTEGLGLVNI